MPTITPYRGRALRLGRCSEPGRIYLLTVVVREREPLLGDFMAGRLLVAELRAAVEAGGVNSLAWVVMPDHFHWLVELREQSLAAVVQRVKGRSARTINRHLRREGTLWQAGYHDHALRREEDVQAVARYVVANPLRARLVRRVGDYPLWDAVWL
ncbi:transposase [Ectopseudomonas alcaliphila JAB1]|nr:transposase [Pseudomonas alcaliphila]APU30800.1 transposase [Pseudomonas alcaliphila JAB1]